MAANTTYSISPERAAIQYAQDQALPIGTKMEVRDLNDVAHRFIVERSSLSRGMLDGGGIRIRSLPPLLRGGGQDPGTPHGAEPTDNIVHARTQAQAALLFAAEAKLSPGSYVSVQAPNGKTTFFQTPV
jgi:hypothetical protein